MSRSIELEGLSFTLPSSSVSIDRDGRYALAYFTGRAVRLDEDLLEASLDAGAVDLSLVRSERCPLLAEHRCRLDSLLGQVVTVEVYESATMRAIVRFARGPEPDRFWSMLQDGFPLSLSIGGSIQHAAVTEELPGSRRLYRATQWRLTELSLVTFGKDKAAYVRGLHTDEDAAQMIRQMQEANDPRREAVRAALHLDRWDRWVLPAGLRMAAKLGEPALAGWTPSQGESGQATMAGSVNKVILVGNLGRDPEVRHTSGNQKIVHLAVATSERWKDRQSSEPRERTEWHRVVIFDENLAEVAERYLRKGSPVYLEGTLRTRKWTDQGGQERYTTEVVVPRFRGELTLLGGGAREGGGTGIGSPEDGDTGYRSPAPGSGPPERGPSDPCGDGSGGRGRPTSIADRLDDDIPF